MFRRRIPRAIRRMGRPNVLPMLQNANQLLIQGRYAEALQAFERLAHGAEERLSERAPYLYIEAGRAAILDGQTQAGIRHFRRGLTLLGSQGRHRRMQTLSRSIMDELRSRGLQNEAAEIEDLLAGNLPPSAPLAEVPISRNPILPTHCPNCGGTLRQDEIEWLDEITGECAYCGSPVRGSSQSE